VHPARLAVAVESYDDSTNTSSSLLEMDPVDFEDLVAALFKAMGMEVMTTARSGDGGVDIRAMDPDPIRGGNSLSRSSDTAAPSRRLRSGICMARCFTRAL
jgi:restriction system protein